MVTCFCWRRLTGAVFALATLMTVAACSVPVSPYNEADHRSRADADRAQLFLNQEEIVGAVSLEEAIARTIKYNLDYRLRLMDEMIAAQQLDLARMDLLPDVTANAGYSTRNSKDATYNGTRTALSSTADKGPHTADLHVTWNVLDFGIGYLAAKQQADQVLIANERRRQVINNIIQQVRGAYWRAAAAERVLGEFGPMLERTRMAVAFSDQQLQENLNRMDTLIYQRQLLETVRQLEKLRRDMQEAKIELALLMNVHPQSQFTTAGVSTLMQEDPPLQILPNDTEALELQAMSNRAELRMEAYQLRVAQTEGRIALLQAIPGLNFSTGFNYTSDSYKVNRRWYDGSLFLTWNILSVFRAPEAVRLAELRQELSQKRQLALSMAIIAQVNVALLNMGNARRDFDLANRLHLIEEEILSELKRNRSIEASSEAELIQGEVRELLSRLERDLAYAEAQAAFGQLVAALGVDPMLDSAQSNSVSDVATAISETLARWESGDFRMTP